MAEAPQKWPLHRIALLALMLVPLAALLLLWTQRRPVARSLINRHFGASGVSACYRLVELGPRLAVLRDLRIGDPARPDLTAGEVVVRFGWSIGGPRLSALDVRGARLRARLDGGRLVLGAIDRLLPAPSGAPFALPSLQLSIADSSVSLATPAGPVGLAVAGQGYLPDGFRGRIAASARALRQQGCAASTRGGADIQTTNREILFAGDMAIGSPSCAGLSAADGRIRFSLTLPERADRWRGDALVLSNTIGSGGMQVQRGIAAVQFAGDGSNTAGVVALRAIAPRYAGGRAQAGRLDGGFAFGRDATYFDGRLRLSAASLPVPRLPVPAGTPLSPLAVRAAQALTHAMRRFDATADVRIDRHVTVRSAAAASLSGADVRLAGPITVGGDRIGGDGKLIVRGGGLPAMSVSLRAAEDRVSLVAEGEAYVAPGARLEPFALRYSEQAGIGLLTGTIAVGGPLGAARIDRLKLPLALRVDCRAGLSGQLTLSKPTLRGNLNGDPLDASADAVRLDWARKLAVDRLNLRLGAGTALQLERLSGDMTHGTLAGLAGRLANVPLVVDKGTGRWQFAGGALTLEGGSARIGDAIAPQRFLPISADRVTIRYDGDWLRGEGRLAKIGTFRLAHRFGSASGEARVTVPGLRFDEEFQPEQLTPLTLGIVADVRGTISGEGEVRWTGGGVVSDGRFRTDGLDLAAAFGPVKGLAGRISFDDLLALATPPGQDLTVAEINPGVSVAGGRIRFQLLAQQRVAVEEGRWPFAGGTLVLEPSLLDFGKVSARRFTLRVEGMDAAAFLQQLEFKNFSATGLFDGRLPLVFQGDGGRIEGGRLAARAPGGVIAYVGEVGGDRLGAAGQFAFDALKKLRYTQLAIALDGELAGEIVSRVDFNGVNEVPVSPAGGGIPVRATGLPFRFNVTVRAPFRGLMNAATSFGDARAVLQQAAQPANLGADVKE